MENSMTMISRTRYIENLQSQKVFFRPWTLHPEPNPISDVLMYYFIFHFFYLISFLIVNTTYISYIFILFIFHFFLFILFNFFFNCKYNIYCVWVGVNMFINRKNKLECTYQKIEPEKIILVHVYHTIQTLNPNPIFFFFVL